MVQGNKYAGDIPRQRINEMRGRRQGVSVTSRR
jgi:hypothetical protein